MSEIPFNINDHVKVKLTSHGKKLHRQQYDELIKKRGFETFEYLPVKEDEYGWSDWQLWELMSRFGEHIHNGCELLFETTILIVTK